jgi:hypothetical protein
MNDRLQQAQKSLEFWQEKLKMTDWDLRADLTDFERTDYIQTGDFKIEGERKAIILISKTPTDKNIHDVVLHEFIHVLLWDFDNFCEQNISPDKKDHYLELLEKTVEIITKKIAL